MKEITEKARNILTSIDCDFIEVRLSNNKSTSITLSGEQTDSFTSGNSLFGSVRVLNKGAWSFISFNDIAEIEAFIKKGFSISQKITPGEKSHVINSKPVTGIFKTTPQKDFRNISLDEKFNLVQNYNTILKSSDYIQTTRATYSDVHSEYIYLNNEGSDILYDKLYCGLSLVSIAKDGSVIQPFHSSHSGYGGFELVENREQEAEQVKKTAIDLLKAESVQGGTYSVIGDQKLAGVFIHEAFGHLSEADFVHENDQLKNIMKLGETFGPAELNVIDDGSIEQLPGYVPFDDEGILPEKTYLIKEGVLSGRLHSRETAYKMNEHPTGNGRALNVMRPPLVRMTNTYIDNGRHNKEELFADIKNGIYAVDVIGGETNLEMFTFTSGYGYEIKNGKPGKMYKDIQLSGNVFSTMKNITMLANDKKMFGGLGGCGKGGQGPLPVSFGGPHILINNVLIGGNQ